MPQTSYPLDWFDIDPAVYERTASLFGSVKSMLGVKMKLHAQNQAERGDIFLFNHFSRFETFIPQILIHEKTGAYSCAVASGEFFKEDTLLSRYLKSAGVFPHDHPRLFPLLASQIFRGRKVIIFPEGGMVKDRRVMDKEGRYSIFSRITGAHRKHHTGAAVLAQGIEAFKATIRNAYSNKDYAQLQRWKDELRLDSLEQLLIAAIKPTLIVPSNITFYPIRASENLLQKGVELISNGLSLRQTEELLVEGNILLKDTDMDIRMGTPVDPYEDWHWWNRHLLTMVKSEFKSLDDVFKLHTAPKNWKQRLLGFYFKKSASNTRNRYMVNIYANVTINLSHIAASLIMHCVRTGQQKIDKDRFYKTLYIAVKHLQNNTRINLHRSLLNPDDYIDLTQGLSKRFKQFICVAKESKLITEDETNYHFLPKLCQAYDIDTIRMENLIAVYNNEVWPIYDVRKTAIQALTEYPHTSAQQMASWQFEDELRALLWEQKTYRKARYDDINRKESATADASPYLLHPAHSNGKGVLLIHGLLARPAELRNYGEHLALQGYTVMGVRLKGHGTSPYALRAQAMEDWFASVVRGFKILSAYTDRIAVAGFSTGGALALKLAAHYPEHIIGVLASSVPIKFMRKSFMLVPFLHGTNKLVEWVSSYEGVKPFIENDTEHPDINYRNTPIKSLYELRRLIFDMYELLDAVTAPTLIIQADEDPIVAASGAKELFSLIGSNEKEMEVIQAHHHGILMDNTAGTWALTDRFLNQL
ncbi:alpha/beta fold hydrolase [Methylicorpusculum sp.]|uniref:alpha/beta fold hydrolase n=1 Tax=Methylicorpusculum sp. TaxID=2713644 RepID=UPI00273121FD|nr:alpha/beta fold hydrolase [Methylicorpusculum sp.]MDP2176888.1 alpha/beta fold hydrolase [Methylicorpusculum sp.]MDP3529993.1 alpha/beta fold hydrolase [Methylicorpusculum sp.]MDZ4149616.1 alpha/beta fold hydrolase [Methylicorpusculum sp.]